MIVFNNCMAFMQGDLFLSRTAADIHTAGTQNSSSRLLFRTLAVHRTALNNGAFDSSSLVNFLNENDWRSSFFGDRRQLGFFKELRAVHSRSTSCKNNCWTCFFKIGFLQTAPAICLYVPRQSILPRDSSPSCNTLSLVLLGHSTVTKTRVFFAPLLVSSPSRPVIGETGIDGTAGWPLSLQGVEVTAETGNWSTEILLDTSPCDSCRWSPDRRSSKAIRFTGCSCRKSPSKGFYWGVGDLPAGKI